MNFRGLGPILGRISIALLFVFLAFTVSCGQQDPSFTEDRTTQAVDSADALAGAGTDSDAGNENPEILEGNTGDGAIACGDGADSCDVDGAGGSTPGSEGGVGIPGDDDDDDIGSGDDDDDDDDVPTNDGTDPVPDPNPDPDPEPTPEPTPDPDPGSEPGIDLHFVTLELVQEDPGSVDILWVVDSSGSMAEEQAYLGSNFNSFINAIEDAGADFQTAVTSTDACNDSIPDDLSLRRCPVSYGGSAATHHRGDFVGDGGNKILIQGQSDIISKFNSYTAVGTNGSGFEHGLKSAQLAIEKSLNGTNETLVRQDAFLAVIVVSDEEDDGIGLSMLDSYSNKNFFELGLTTFSYTEDNFVDYLRATKGEGNFSVSTITGTRNPDGSLCSAPHSQPREEGTQYIAAAQKTGGIVQSICDSNWSSSLSNIGYDMTAQITQVPLQEIPDAATVKVYVNDTLTLEWTYNSGNNAVKFNTGHVPEAGDTIRIEFWAY